MLLHIDAFTHTLSHTEAFTHRSFHTQKLFYTNIFTHTETGPVKSQFYLVFWRSNLISRERVCRTLCKSPLILPRFLAIEPHFARKGVPDRLQIASLPQFLAIEPRFVRNGCVSCHLVGTAPCLQERNRKEGESKRARGQEGKRECEDARM